MAEHVCVLNYRNAAGSAYSAPVAYPQPANTSLPMDYGQGLCQYFSISHCCFSKTNVIGINNFTICIYWLLLRHKFELVCCRSRVTVIHSPAVQDVYFFGKMSGRGCSHNMCFSHLGHIYQTHPTT